MTSIQGLVEKIKGFEKKHRPNLRTISDDLFLGLIIILVAFGSFGLGRLSKIDGSKTPVRFENVPENNQSANIISATNDQLIGSKNGTKYYYSWCAGVQNILPTNLIHFASKSDALARGYTASATCKGL